MTTKEELSVLTGVRKENWFNKPLNIFVFGASGDLSKKKTFPALLDLYIGGLLPKKTQIVGYARSSYKLDAFKAKIKPFLLKRCENETKVNEFLELCFYRNGDYDAEKVLKGVTDEFTINETQENRLFYFALPPQAFVSTAKAVKAAMTRKSNGKKNGWFERVVIEKPFGHDTSSAAELSKELSLLYTENQLYRIDHYLGKELVQNILFLRFANAMTEAIWSRNYIKGVTITFKEDIDVQGRGGYFEKSGIIRDIIQNHLMQVLSLVAMEPPSLLRGKGSSELIRDEKVKVLKSIKPFKLEDCVLGQYEGYCKDVEVKESSRETFACIVTYIQNRRWFGVPFVLKAGKAVDERKAEVRIQLKNPPAYFHMFNEEFNLPRQEIVIRLQPNEAIYVKTNVKKPGLGMDLVQSELNLTYKDRHDSQVPDAYTRLILDVLRGRQSTFVRDDELMEAWRIVTPLLKEIETSENLAKPGLKVSQYKRGSRGPKEADDLIQKSGIKYFAEYRENYQHAKKQKLKNGK